MSVRRTILAAALFAVLAMPSTASADCTISTTSMAFGTYNVFNVTPVDSTASVTYRCGLWEWLLGLPINITLNTGQSGTYAARTMRKGTEPLSYNLYRDPTFSQVWGNLSQGTSIYSTTRPPLLTYVTVPLYGRVPAGQDVSAGVYTDTVVATINF